jgi:hypothetical protein
LIGKVNLTPSIALPHPKKLHVSAAMFMDLYLPVNHKKDNYGRITLVNPQNPAVKYEGKLQVPEILQILEGSRSKHIG